MINFQVISGKNSMAGAMGAAKYPQEKQEIHHKKDGTEYSTGYYTEDGGAPSEWLGIGAEAQGLSGAVNEQDLANAYLGQIKDGPDISNRGGKSADADRRYAMDLTLSAPKSVSIAALAGGDERLIAAHDKAVRAAMEYVENNMVYARKGKGGAESEFTGNAVIASHRHETSRTVDGIADPQLHTHNLVLNQTQREDGQWVSARLDFGHNNEKFNVLDSIYKAELAKEVKAAGYEIEHTKDGFEIKGITRENIEDFSRRKTQIDAALDEAGTSRDQSSAQQRDAANLRTRGHKSQLNDVDQKYEWRQRVREKGMNLQGLREKSELRAEQQKGTDHEKGKITGKDAVKSAIHHLSERDSTFSKTQLMDEALKAGLGDVSHADIENAINARAGGLISAGEIDRGEGKKEEQFTTKHAVLREAEILQRAKDGKRKADAIIATPRNMLDQENQSVVQEKDVSFTQEEIENGKSISKQQHARREITGFEKTEPLTEHSMRNMSERGMDANEQRENPSLLHTDARSGGSGDHDLRRADDRAVSNVISEREAKQGFSFSSGQREAVALALATTDQHIGIVGAAGAGKTTAMAAIVEQYQKAGYEIIGVAPSAAAAHELESAGCNDTRTLASALLQKQEQKSTESGTSKKLYVLDEAGMVSAKDMDAFLRKADQEGARTILVGDPRQLAAVEAGSPYAQMLDTGAIEFANIDEIQRQKDLQLREIAQAFAKGDAAKGVDLAKPYMQQVSFDKGDGKQAKTDALATAAADAYMGLSPDERSKTLLLAGTNETRQAINSKIRDGLISDGTLGDKAVKITALDKLDLTREAATRAEHYQSKDGAQVVIQFNTDLKNKDTNSPEPILAKKGSQWNVTSTEDGKLQLQSRENPDQQIEMQPTDARISAYSAREMELRNGDRVAFRQNQKDQGITNGMQGTVNIDENGKTSIKTDTGQEIEIAKNRGQTLDYSYARTVHSSQGATVERAIVVGEASRVATAESAYVACSREKTGLQIITDDSEKLGKAWGKFAERQTALDAAKQTAPQTLEEIQKARMAAGREIGSVGDLAQVRASGNASIAELPSQTQAAEKESEKLSGIAQNGDAHDAQNVSETETPEQKPQEETEQQEQQQMEPEMEMGS